MPLTTVAGHRVGADTEDLRMWLRTLDGCPEVTHTVVAACLADTHAGGERPTWFFVEADPSAGVARRRCVGCGGAHDVLDSGEAWTHPPMHACGGCGQSMMEVAAGLHSQQSAQGPLVSWVAVAARCVMCGRIDGLTDFVLPDVMLDQVAASI